ncbi:MAG: GNAT family N-acetyltransferase [FCB group bacterium]|nr:GNAT family N-acetyltransferase [FCB group bacterium]
MDPLVSAILNNDPQRHMASLGFFDNYPVKAYYIKGGSALVLGESDHLWMHCVGDSGPDMCVLLEEHHRLTPYYYSVEDNVLPCILKYGDSDWIFRTERYVLNDEIHPETPVNGTCRLEQTDAAYIYGYSDYQTYTSLAYICDRLQRDISVGIRIAGRLVAWGFTHDDGALGFLYVLKAYRGRGYASSVLQELIRLRRQTGKPVFCNIVPDNDPSISLVRKTGFRLDRAVSWLKLKA